MGYLEKKRDAMVGMSKWYIVPGLSMSDCIAAYKFKGARNETEALTDLTGHGYNLAKNLNPEWNASKGYNLKDGFLNNSSLRDVDKIGTVVIRYSGLPSAGAIQLTNIKAQGAYDYFKHFTVAARLRFTYYRADYEGTDGNDVSLNVPGIMSKWVVNNPNDSKNEQLTYRYGSVNLYQGYRTGVLAATRTQLYLNGEAMTTTAKTVKHVTGIGSSNAGNPNTQTLTASQNGHWIIAAAFYIPAITSATTHQRLYENMTAI